MDQPPLFDVGPERQPGKCCCHCKQWKTLDEYNRRTTAPDGRQARCRDCNKAYHYANWDRHMTQIRKRTLRVLGDNRRRLLAHLLKNPCVDCGEADPVVLEFDHLRDKRRNVTAMLRGSPWSTVLEEIAKCAVVCANCHRRRTFDRSRSWRTHGIRGPLEPRLDVT